MTTAEEKKAAEANGTEVLKEVRCDNVSDGPSEEIPQYEKRNRKAECIYITIAVVLGAALIGVLVYFSVTNAFDSKEAEPVAGRNTGGETTDLYTTTDLPSTTDQGFNNNAGQGGLTRDSSGPGVMGGNSNLRRAGPGTGLLIGGDTSSSTSTTTSAPAKMLRGGPGMLRRGMPTPPPGTESETSGESTKNEDSTASNSKDSKNEATTPGQMGGNGGAQENGNTAEAEETVSE